MKKLFVAAFALAVTLCMGVTGFTQAGYGSQGSYGGSAKSDKSAAMAPLKNLKGTVMAQGEKVTFVTDKDSKTWSVMNPEALKGHEGHHVQLSAHVYADKDTIHVMSVKMLKADAKP